LFCGSNVANVQVVYLPADRIGPDVGIKWTNACCKWIISFSNDITGGCSMDQTILECWRWPSVYSCQVSGYYTPSSDQTVLFSFVNIVGWNTFIIFLYVTTFTSTQHLCFYSVITHEHLEGMFCRDICLAVKNIFSSYIYIYIYIYTYTHTTESALCRHNCINYVWYYI